MNDFIPVNEPLLGGNEKKYVLDCLDTGWISSEGPYVSRFEEEFSRRVDRKYGISCSNGSAALDIAVSALNIKTGDEVIVPSFTIISCAASIVRAGGVPVLIDADPLTYNLDAEKVEDAITSKTVAIMVVHIYGLPVDLDPVLNIAEKYSLFVIEDAAELIGGSYKGRPIGSFGHLSTFSFYPNKHITTGEGGMVVANDLSLADRCRSLRNLCFKPEKRFVHDELGWNYRLTNIQAALGLAQLERLDESLAIKRRIGRWYNDLLVGCSSLRLPLASTRYAENLYWVYGLLLKSPHISSELIRSKLAELGVGTRPFFYPLHLQPALEGRCRIPHPAPVSEMLYSQGFYIPSGIALKYSQAKHVAASLHGLLHC